MSRKTFVGAMVGLTVLVAALLGPAVAPAEATHARYANYHWRPTGVANEIEFVIQNAFRRSSVGIQCINPATLAVVACTGPGGLPGIGDVVVEGQGGTQFSPDGIAVISSPLGALLYLVTSIDPANDWFVGNALDPDELPAVDTTIAHTYAGPGNYTAFTDSCCRLSAVSAPNEHLNNPDGGYRFETLVNVGGTNRSPVASVPVIVLCPINALCLFPVSAADPDGDTLRWRLSNPAEASSSAPFINSHGSACATTFCQPGPPF